MSVVKIKSSFFLDIVKEHEKLEIPIFQRDYNWTKDIFLIIWNEIIHPLNQYFDNVTFKENLYYKFKEHYEKKWTRSEELRKDFYQNNLEEILSNEEENKLANNLSNFLGNLIILKEEGNNSKIDIVDGQQRLSTIFIIIASLLKNSSNKNNFFLMQLNENIIRKENFKIGLKFQYSRENKESNQQWEKIFDFEENDTKKSKWNSKNSNIIKFFELTNKELQFFLSKTTDEYEKNIIIEFIVARIMKIQFSITEINNLIMAFDVFQKTNSNFTPLFQSDLIKSSYIKIMSKEEINNEPIQKWKEMTKNLFDSKETKKGKKLTSFLRYSTTIYKIINKDNKSKIYIKEKDLFKNEYKNDEKRIEEKIEFALKLSKIYKKFFRIKKKDIYNTKYNLLWNRFLNIKSIKVLSLYTLYITYIYKEKYDLSNSLSDIESFNKIIENVEDFFIKAFKINGIKSQTLDADLPKILREIHENEKWKNDEYVFNKKASDFLLKKTNNKFKNYFTISNKNEDLYNFLLSKVKKENKNWSSINHRYLISKALSCHIDDIKFKKIKNVKNKKLIEELNDKFNDIELKEWKEKAINHELKIDSKNYSIEQKIKLKKEEEKYNKEISDLIDEIEILIDKSNFASARDKYLNSGKIFIKLLKEKKLLKLFEN